MWYFKYRKCMLRLVWCINIEIYNDTLAFSDFKKQNAFVFHTFIANNCVLDTAQRKAI